MHHSDLDSFLKSLMWFLLNLKHLCVHWVLLCWNTQCGLELKSFQLPILFSVLIALTFFLTPSVPQSLEWLSYWLIDRGSVPRRGWVFFTAVFRPELGVCYMSYPVAKMVLSAGAKATGARIIFQLVPWWNALNYTYAPHIPVGIGLNEAHGQLISLLVFTAVTLPWIRNKYRVQTSITLLTPPVSAWMETVLFSIWGRHVKNWTELPELKGFSIYKLGTNL